MLKIARFTFYMFGINTYVVYDPELKEAAIIDPGMSRKEEFDAMEKFIVRENLTVTHLINTHIHIDHAIADKWVMEKYNLPVEAHEDDSTLGLVLNQQAQRFGIRGVDAKIEIGKILNDGDDIKIGNGTLRVLHVPGHSPGSIALYDKEDGFVIVGDTLFEGSIGRTDLMGGDHAQLINAITYRLLTLPDDTVVYPGHGSATTVGREKASNPYL
ncbi:MAG: MBL fold metallo-hydrolase [Muribaculum sp.]|nr:MBL fold metallo-hydrolase [Muribaculum sp.]